MDTYLAFQATAGCRTVENRSVINTPEVKEEKRKREATGLKELGNQVPGKFNVLTNVPFFRLSEEESMGWLRSTTQAP